MADYPVRRDAGRLQQVFYQIDCVLTRSRIITIRIYTDFDPDGIIIGTIRIVWIAYVGPANMPALAGMLGGLVVAV